MDLQIPNGSTKRSRWLESGVAVEAAETADTVPFDFAVLDLGSNGDTGKGAAGEASPGTGFSPASGLMSSGVGVALFSTSVIGLESSKGALDAGPCHIEALGRLPVGSCRSFNIGIAVGVLARPNVAGPCHIVAFALFALLSSRYCRLTCGGGNGRLSGGA